MYTETIQFHNYLYDCYYCCYLHDLHLLDTWWELRLLVKIIGGCSAWRTNDLIMSKGGGVSEKHFPVIWTLKIWKHSRTMLGYSLENPDLSIELWKDLSLGLIVKGVSKVVFIFSTPHVDPGQGYLYIIWKVCTRNNLKTPFAHYASGIGNFMQNMSYFVTSLVVTCSLMPWL